MHKKSYIYDYFTLCKPKVVLLMLITTWVGMHLASNSWVPWQVFFFGTLGIALAAGAAAVINHIVDRHIDAKMTRTSLRPIANGRIAPKQALIFAAGLGILAMIILLKFINLITAILTFSTLLGYAVLYTIFLKRATPQNIVIGGAAGAMPPLLGWSCISGTISPFSLLLVLIIFTWTPPHFWSLAIYREQDYAKAKIPMLPITHGVNFTKLYILLYTLLLIPVTILPFIVGMSNKIYLILAIFLDITFLYYAIKLYFSENISYSLKIFNFSILYLLLLFTALLLDHYIYI